MIILSELWRTVRRMANSLMETMEPSIGTLYLMTFAMTPFTSNTYPNVLAFVYFTFLFSYSSLRTARFTKLSLCAGLKEESIVHSLNLYFRKKLFSPLGRNKNKNKTKILLA